MKPRGRPKDSRAVGLLRRADLLRTAGEQGFAGHLEEAAGVVVDVDEGALVDVEHHDHFGRMLHQGSVARLAFAHGLLGQMPLGDVADADDVAVAPVELGLADRDLDRNAIAALGAPPGQMRRQVHVGVVDLEAKRSRNSVVAPATSGSKNSSERPRISAERVAEDAFAGGIEGLDVAGVVHRHDGVLDVVEDGLQMRGGLLANLARERLRLVGHELHRAHDAAPLAVDAVVVRADGLEQRLEVQLAAPAPGLRDLAFKQVVQAFRRLRGLATYCGRDIA